MSEVSVAWHELIATLTELKVSFAKDHDVLTSSEWIQEEVDWFHNHFGVLG